MAQKKLFNGKELQDELRLGWIDYEARNYMPDLGRWMSPDPLTERVYEYTPYNYVVNNPIAFIDPTGQWFVFFFEEGEKGDKQREYIENTLNKLLGDQFSVGWETNSNGSRTLKLNKKKGGGDKDKLSKAGQALVDAATDEDVISLINVTENDEGVNVGSFSLQKIDIDDVKRLSKGKGSDTPQGLIVHELVEQHEKSKEGIDIGKIFKNGSLAAFKKAHKNLLELKIVLMEIRD